MKSYYLGLDLGTSSVKGILRSTDGDSIKGKSAYSEKSVEGWKTAIREMLAEMLSALKSRNGAVAAIALSSQVGTYVIDEKDVIGWQSAAGKAELAEIKSKITQDEFIDVIGMPYQAAKEKLEHAGFKVKQDLRKNDGSWPEGEVFLMSKVAGLEFDEGTEIVLSVWDVAETTTKEETTKEETAQKETTTKKNSEE